MAEVSQARTVTTTQLKKIMEVCVRAKRPLFIHGSPGVGKSSVVAEVCKLMGGKLFDLRLSQIDQVDLRGMPFYNRDTGLMEWAPPVDLPSKEEAAKYPVVFVFLDEMNSAAPAIMATAYQLCLDRKCGTYSLPDNAVIIAAGNKNTDGGVVYKMPTPLSNRFVHAELRIDFESWNDWAVDTRIHPDVIGFLEVSKHSLCDFDPKSPNRSFATPRTWEFVSQILFAGIDEQTATDILAGTIGEGLALKFQAHRKTNAALPKAEHILDGKVKELKTKDISAHYSLITSLVYELDERAKKQINTKEEPEWHAAADNMLGFIVANMGPEIQTMGMRMGMQKFNLPFDPKKLTNFKAFYDKVGKLLVKAVAQ